MQTTIKVSSDLRDRINESAKEQGLSAAAFIDDLLQGWHRQQRMAEFGRAFRSADEGYWDEFAECDRLS
ncbi:MAG: hypothetical protein Q4C71_02555 [Microbacteriaceae bacterium]|nr:hypothetical protein [Microbacteriaceae bacterium]